jgi:hypothetical protein
MDNEAAGATRSGRVSLATKRQYVVMRDRTLYHDSYA